MQEQTGCDPKFKHHLAEAREIERTGGLAVHVKGHGAPENAAEETERLFDKLTVLSIAPLLARAIKEVFEDGSVTSLFDGAS